MRHVLCVLVLSFCCVCGCVLATGEVEGLKTGVAGGDEVCPSKNTGSKCENKPKQPEDSPECLEPEKEKCSTEDGGSEENCRKASETPCPQPPEPAPTTKEPNRSGGEPGVVGPGAAIIPNSDSEAGENQEKLGGKVELDAAGQKPLAQIPATSTATPRPVNGEERDPVLQGTDDTGTGVQRPIGGSDGSAHPPAASPIAAGAAVEGSNGSSPSGGQTGANVNNPAGEGAVNAESTAAVQPTSPSPESSDTETANGSGTANDGGSSTSPESEPSNNPSDEESTTTSTTTTTNIIPPVPGINNNNIMPNVKGDADSSSSISSSVWVRVLLLIVVTLACILVC
ncbi:uncharacterized protein TM35_000551240 [Trypanosoma theileri]|uniref:Mucin-associated surface protein (MASP) n=1 Tax=Trypanosoma theileri TaxID=67003 RepID=A0A1X0NGL2_9TRYP|nr:uncharacterized protein TM35_000551240 [Trypanosoma theileri]ORC83855.1 hypothetical protein TM35_000551240 [Trypanosoma theileri]